MSLPGISKHLKVLERGGLISRRRDAQFRPCHLEAGTLEGALDWMEKHRRLWEERFEKLDTHLRHVTARDGSAPSDDRAATARRSRSAAATTDGKRVAEQRDEGKR
jgi:hypothetical protein